jgi:hypothetical protein
MVDAATSGGLSILFVALVPILLFFMFPAGTRAAFASGGQRTPTGLSQVRLWGTKAGDGMPILPEGVVKYSQVPAKDKFFTADKIPRGLLQVREASHLVQYLPFSNLSPD